MYLDLDKNVKLKLCNYKKFQKNEFHVTRICRDDVLILMLGGRLNFTENGEETELSSGEYYVQRKGLFQSASRPSDDAYYVYFHFDGCWCDEGIHGLPVRGNFDVEKIYRDADNLCRATKSKDRPLVSMMRMFYGVLEELLEENKQLDKGYLIAERIHGYISENYAENIDVADVAKHFSYSPDYVIRLFKRAYGVTPHSYMTSCRIEYAKLLLSTTQLRVGEISAACGYSDFTTFYRAFHEKTGRSPKEWRNGSAAMTHGEGSNGRIEK